MEFSWISPHKPALVLAPMEGLTDSPMRALLTERGGFSFCVSEFLRINQEVPPNRTFFEHVPEFHTACQTPSGVPVQIQLLGGDEERMALSANRACELGARAIDINFGCPAPSVNRHDGGATLLKYPDRIRSIVSKVRNAVPSSIPVSAKLRLGWENMDDIFKNAEQAALGGASWITIHARTKMQGYTPPAHWKYVGEVRKQLEIPVVANGEIWTREDFLKCQEVTGCKHFMIGRGALANPLLAHEISRSLGMHSTEFPTRPFVHHPKNWEPILLRFSELAQPKSRTSHYTACRIKHWLRLASSQNSLYPWFDEIKRTKNLEEIFSILRS